EPGEQVLDVGLVARPPATEDVGVDDDERRHAAASRYTSSMAAAAATHEKARARSSPSPASSSRRASADSIPAAIEPGSCASTSSRFVNSETATISLAARATRGTARRL